MWTWLKRLWQDEDYAARALKAAATGVGVYVATPQGRTNWERAIPALLTMIGVALPSGKPKAPDA
jgi:hypothetical protein